MVIIYKLFSSNLLKNSALYVIADGLNRAIPFLLLPIIVRYLTPEDYGIVTNYAVLIQIMGVFVFGAAQGSIPVNYFKMSKQEFQGYLVSIFSLALLVSFVFLVLVVISHVYIEDLLNLNYKFLLLSVVEVMLSAFTCVNMLMWRCEEKPVKFGVYQIIQTLLTVILTIVMVVFLKMAWEGKILANFAITFLMGLLSLVILHWRKYYRLKLDFTYSKMVLAFALPLIPHALALWGKTGVDKVLITNLVGLSENGLYSTAITWGAIITIVNTSFSNAYSPYLFKQLAKFDKMENANEVMRAKKKIVKLSYLFVAGLAVIVFLSYFVFYALIIFIYPESYHGATKFLFWILLGEFFRGWYMIYICYVHYTFNTKVLGAITFSLSLLQVALSYLLILSMGTIGAAISTCIVSILTTIGVGLFSNRVYYMPWLLNYNRYAK